VLPATTARACTPAQPRCPPRCTSRTIARGHALAQAQQPHSHSARACPPLAARPAAPSALASAVTCTHVAPTPSSRPCLPQLPASLCTLSHNSSVLPHIHVSLPFTVTRIWSSSCARVQPTHRASSSPRLVALLGLAPYCLPPPASPHTPRRNRHALAEQPPEPSGVRASSSPTSRRSSTRPLAVLVRVGFAATSPCQVVVVHRGGVLCRRPHSVLAVVGHVSCRLSSTLR
jgi:hypothetical protein